MSAPITATLDRIEQNQDGSESGVLVFDDGQQLTVPLERLPDGCREGAVLQVTWRVDEDATEQRRSRIRDLQSRLFNRNEPVD